MSHDRNMPKKPKRKVGKKQKKRKGLPPHLQRAQQRDSISEIQRYLDEVRERTKSGGRR